MTYDEYTGNHENFFKERIRDKRKNDKYKEIKFIVTTRLESGYPTDLLIDKKEDTFVRLFPFQNDANNESDGKKQTDSFFVKYGISLEYDTLKNYIDSHVLAKPLFCWMIAYTFQGNINSLTRLDISKDYSNSIPDQEKLNSAIIYLSCFHSIIKGRHKESLEQDSNFNFKEQHIKEKSILRKIAALKEIYGDSLTYEIAREKIKKFESESNSNKLSADFDKVFGDIVSSYFYYPSEGRSEKKIEFMHKSFREFFLAEYIIESIIANKPHRLHLVASTNFSVITQFLIGLFQIIVTIEKDDSSEEIYSLFIESLKPKYSNYTNESIADIIINNSKNIVETEIFIFRANVENENNVGDTLRLESTNEGIWAIKKLEKYDYREMFQHRWISLFCLTNTFYNKHIINKDEQQPGKREHIIFKNKDDICAFIRLSSNLINSELKCLIKSDLSGANLHLADLFSANLHIAKLSNANLSSANLFSANLHIAKLSNANLSSAKLSNANLSSANLSSANLSAANLSQSLLINIREFQAQRLDRNTVFQDSLTDSPEFIVSQIAEIYTSSP